MVRLGRRRFYEKEVKRKCKAKFARRSFDFSITLTISLANSELVRNEQCTGCYSTEVQKLFYENSSKKRCFAFEKIKF